MEFLIIHLYISIFYNEKWLYSNIFHTNYFFILASIGSQWQSLRNKSYWTLIFWIKGDATLIHILRYTILYDVQLHLKKTATVSEDSNIKLHSLLRDSRV